MSRRLKILVVAGIVLGLAILVPVIHHFQLRAATEAYIAELKAKGEPMELAQVLPPPVPPEQNSASNFLKAVSLLNTDYGVLGSNSPFVMRMIVPGKAIIGWMQPDVHSDYGIGEKSWEEIEAALAEDGEGLKLLRRIADHPALDFNLVYSNGVDKIQIPYLASEKKSAQRLSAAAIDDLHRGDSTSAVKNVRAMLALVNGMSHDRMIISELVRIAIAQMALPVMWEAAKQMVVTAIALKRYQLKRGNYPTDLNSLVPEFVSTVPLDPVDGQPLRYRSKADGTFLLYSVGENGKDDGGDPSLGKGVTGSNFSWQNDHALDWVWPQPATEEEIQKFYAQQNDSR